MKNKIVVQLIAFQGIEYKFEMNHNVSIKVCAQSSFDPTQFIGYSSLSGEIPEGRTRDKC